MSNKIIVVALGGNAIIEEGTKGTIQEQFANTRKSMASIASLIQKGYQLILSHGNGPQVGLRLIKNEVAAKTVAPTPLTTIVADTQGSMGYMIAQCLHNSLIGEAAPRNIAVVITQVLVNPKDPSMQNPTKFVGPFYRAEEVPELTARGWILKEDSGRGFRRVVPSPAPLDIIEKDTIKSLVQSGTIVIAAGGGGVPVQKDASGVLSGVDAVIDKDRASALLAKLVNAESLCILTGVDRVAINYRKPDERFFSSLTLAECEKYLSQGQFPAGSMGPKIEAACDFIRWGGKKVFISSLEKALDAIEGRAGTIICP